MADLNSINLEITGASTGAQAAVQSTIQALDGLKNVANSLSGIKFAQNAIKGMNAIGDAMKGIASAAASFQSDGAGSSAALAGFASAVNQVASACKSLKDEDVARLQTVANVMNAASGSNWSGNAQAMSNAVQASRQSTAASGGSARTSTAGMSFGGSFTSAYKSAKQSISSVVSAVKKMGNAFDLSSTHVGKFVSSLARVAKMRLLRSIISSITRGATTGLKNLAYASSEANATLSQLSSASLTLKNSLGGALYSALAGVVGILQTIANAAASAMNWINMLFSALGGKSTFKKATATTTQYADSLGGAAGSAKALKQELMGFDEINSLSPDSSGGGGGGGSGSLDYGSMFEETAIDADLLEAIETADFTKIGAKLADKINNALSGINWEEKITKAGNLGTALSTFINGAVSEIDPDMVGEAIAGAVNTGLTFVDTFVETTNWRGLGEKLKLFIQRAIKGISPKQVGSVLAAKVKIVLRTLSGLLPTTYDEWKELTDWIAEAIASAINDIDEDDIADAIERLTNGALAGVTSLGESHALTNLTGKILGAITTALDAISPEDVEKASDAILEELRILMGQLLTFTFDTLKIVIKMDNPVVTGVTAWGITSLLQKALPFLGLSNGKSGGVSGLQMTGTIYFAMDAVAKVGSIVESVKNGEGVSWQDVADTLSSAFMSVGIAVGRANLAAGAIVMAVGVILKVVASVETVGSSEYDRDLVEGVLNNQEWIELGEAGGGLDLPLETLKENVAAALGEGFDTGELDAAMQNAIDRFNESLTSDLTLEQAQLLVEALYPGKYDTSSITGLADGLETVLQVVSELDAYGLIEDNPLEALLSFAGLDSEFEPIVEAVTETVDAINTAGEELEPWPEMEIPVDELLDASGEFGSLSETTEEINASMQATGEQAEELATKIIEIPSDIVYNLELHNYDVVMEQLDDLKDAVSDAGELGGSGFKTALSGLGAWVADNVVTPITDAFSGIDLASAGRKMMRTLKQGMRAIQLPKFKITWESNTSAADVMGEKYTVSIPTPKITTYAQGGFLSAGELFVANEAGPELIGRIGNKSAVANESQIGDAIFKYMDAYGGSRGTDANALASALVSAMKSAGLGAVYLDGKMLGNSINREAKRSGKPVINF